MGDPVFGWVEGEVKEMEEDRGSRSIRDQGGIAEQGPSRHQACPRSPVRVHSRVRELG